MLRLRQIALVAHDLDDTVGWFAHELALRVAHRDPAVAVFGLHNAVMPVGQQFLEVVAPTRSGTTAGRYLDRRHGDGGYMVILQCDEHAARKRRIGELGIRTALADDTPDYRLLQLHPADTGGSFLEIDEQIGGDDLDGPWMPAGADWQQARCTDVVDAIVAAEIQSVLPATLAETWGSILQRPAADVGAHHEIELDNAVLRFVEAADGRGEGLGGIDLRAADRTRAGTSYLAAGMRIRLV